MQRFELQCKPGHAHPKYSHQLLDGAILYQPNSRTLNENVETNYDWFQNPFCLEHFSKTEYSLWKFLAECQHNILHLPVACVPYKFLLLIFSRMISIHTSSTQAGKGVYDGFGHAQEHSFYLERSFQRVDIRWRKRA